MTDSAAQHAFVSYVRGDSDAVDKLCGVLEAAQIPYWRDQDALAPGASWRAEIRRAIRNGSLVFLACFSAKSNAKEQSYMNEELNLAIEEFRQMPPGRTWLIPVRFDDVELPDWDLGGGQTMADLNYIDLFGPQYATNAVRLTATIQRVMGAAPTDASTSVAVVEQVSEPDRADLVVRLTKEMLPDPRRRIELDDVIASEVARVLDLLNDNSRVSESWPATEQEQVVRVVEWAQELWSATAPFCASLRVAARWGTPDQLTPWADGLRAFTAAAVAPTNGIDPLVQVKHLPAMASITAAAAASVAARHWESLHLLILDHTVFDRYEGAPVSLLEATSPWEPFKGQELLACVFARSAIENKTPSEAYADYRERQAAMYHTPEAEWLYHTLRPLLADQWPDKEECAWRYDQVEVLLGLLCQDATDIRATNQGLTWSHSRWFGRSTWRARRRRSDPLGELAKELQTQGAAWPPIRAGLFGGDLKRATNALQQYRESFQQISRRQH